MLQAKGKCFQEAFELLDQLTINSAVDRFLLVHGRVMGLAPDGRVAEITHAWIEDSALNVVRDFSNGMNNILPTANYYVNYSASPIVRYTISEAREMLLTCGHYGPWSPQV